jgi:3-deoxy-D-manno-octulosonic-acid transferase
MNAAMGYILLFLENLAFPFAAPGYLIFFFLSPRRNLLKNLGDELSERFVRYGREKGAGFENALWIHAASVGEARSVAGLMEHIRERFPSRKIIVTSSTAAGREAAKNALKADLCLLAPLDFYPLQKKFIRIFRPACLIVVETELWPSMFAAAGGAGVKICVANGRLSAKSARGYGLLKPLFKLMAKNAAKVLAQSPEDAARYVSIGFPAEKVTATGNIKYDLLAHSPSRALQAEEIITKLGWRDSKLLVCGSVHPLEEELFVPLIKTLRKTVPGFKIAIAQRHLERQPALLMLLQGEGIYFAMLSDRLKSNAPSGADCLVLDAMGWLTAFYSVSTAAFVGGTIAPRGGHNLLEPAVTGRPVLFGPNTWNTPDVAAALLKSGGGISIKPGDAADKIAALFCDPQGLALAAKNAAVTAESFRGATEKTAALVEDVIADAG